MYSIAIAPSDSDRIYLIWNGYLYKSTNGGDSFTRTAFTYRSNLDANDSYRTYTGKMAVDPNDPDVVYAGTVSNGLFRTLDGGTTWSSVSGVTAGATAGHCGIAFDRTSGTTNGRTNVIYAGSYGNGVWRSADAGETWTRISSTLTSCSAGYCGNTSGVYYCVSGTTLAKYSGGSWTNLDTSEFQNRSVSVLTIPSDNTKVVAAIDAGTLAVSTNSGSTWSFKGWWPTRTATDVPWLAWTEEDYMSTSIIVPDPVTSGRVWLAQGIGVWYTDNVDASPTAWTSQSKGIEQLVASWLWSVPGGSLFAAAWDRPVFRITDPDTFPSMHGTNRDHAIIKGFSVEHAVDDTSFLVADAGWFGDEESSYSTDGGATWTKFAAVPPWGTAGKGHLAVSTTTNWVWMSNANQAGYYTTNGGTSWTKLSFPSPFVDDTSSQGWGGFDAQLYLDRHIVCADRVTTGTFYAYHNGETSPSVFKTTNGGATWTRVYSSRLTTYSMDYWNGKLKAVPGKAGHLFWTPGHVGGASSPASGAYLMRSTDGGASWSAVSGLLEIYDFGFGKTPSGGSYPSVHVIGWVDGVYGVWRSDDNCANWTNIGAYPLDSLDFAMVISGDENVEGRTYVGFKGSGFAYYDV